MSAARRGGKPGKRPSRGAKSRRSQTTARRSTNGIRGAARRSDGRSAVGWLILGVAVVSLVALGLNLDRLRQGTGALPAVESVDQAVTEDLKDSYPPVDPPETVASFGPEAVDDSLIADRTTTNPNDGLAADPPAADARGAGALVALVIDDLGRDLKPLELLAGLGVPVSYAVLPFESETPAVAEWLRRGGHEVLVHLPMQAQGAANPGPGALYTNLDVASLRQRTRRAIDAVPGAVGVNNHMGSAFTADPAKMRPVLAEIAERQLFFLDSRTSGRSVAFQMALELGIPSARRSVFLDNQPEVEAISRQFDEVLALAGSRGSAIAIGHPYESTLETLVRRVPRAQAQGFQFVPVSFLLERSAAPGD